MKKILTIIILCHTALFAATETDSIEALETQLVQSKKLATLEYIPGVERFLKNGELQHSFQIQIAEIPLKNS